MKKVQIRYGPRDGDILEISDYHLEVTFQIPEITPLDYTGPPPALKTVSVPIKRTNIGTYYVETPKELR